MTKLDVLSGQSVLKICTGYRHGSRRIDDFPALPHEFQELTPEYIELPGWQDDITQVRSWDELPRAAQNYIRELERLVGCPVCLVSVGPGREATIPLSLSPLLQGFLG